MEGGLGSTEWRWKAKLLESAFLVSIFTVLPPDRVGVIRQPRHDVALVLTQRLDVDDRYEGTAMLSINEVSLQFA